MKATVLLSCGGGAAGITALQLLRRVAPELTLVVADRDPFSYAREVADVFRVIEPDVRSMDYPRALLKVICDTEAHVALPCHSHELSQYLTVAGELRALGTLWPEPAPRGVALTGDKLALYQALEAAGVAVPRYAAVTDEGRRAFERTAVVFKARDGAGSRGLYECGPDDPVPETVMAAPARYLEQEKAQGSEVSLDGVVLSDNQVVGPVARRRLATRSGLAVVGESLDLDHAADALFRSVASTVGTRGALNVQVFYYEGVFLGVTDVNPRFPAGGMALTDALGLNMPWVVVTDLLLGAAAVDVNLPPFRLWRHYRHWADALLPLEGRQP